ncbi:MULTISPECIES: hypothetical protein [Streptomyces]|uniref:hypothetical protein n=1 Tax=Streptomyces sp. B146 TaxID=2944251 RepID=UPI00240E36C7|nr:MULTISPECIES: hypothetical protein [Streptomyces]WFB81999.1 hypothetical protein MMU79_01025 [Streptomyces olivaceus]WGK44333.1 hypothetical protein M6G09_01250 [Streptomyces sp. B146]
MPAKTALRWGAPTVAACIAASPVLEQPKTPTWPSLQDCAASHSVTSYASEASVREW